MTKINMPLREYDPEDKVQRCELCHYWSVNDDHMPINEATYYCVRRADADVTRYASGWCGDFVHLAKKSNGRYVAKRKGDQSPAPVPTASDLPQGERPYTLWDERGKLGEGWEEEHGCFLYRVKKEDYVIFSSESCIRKTEGFTDYLPNIRNINDLNKFVEVLTWAMGMKGDA